MMTHLGLFEGIGGFALAARWAQWETLAWCEWNPLCQKVLKYHFPKAKAYGDINDSDFSEWEGRIDVVSGGFPCQPFSHAGSGKGTEDKRYMWPQMFRAIQQIKPRWVVAENVYGILDNAGGMVFKKVLTDLESEGYEVQAYCIPAHAINAPHRRDRIWIVARLVYGFTSNTNSNGLSSYKEPSTNFKIYSDWRPCNDFDSFCLTWPSSWSESTDAKPRFQIESPICGQDDGIPGGLVNITLSDWIDFALSAFGNAIVPHVAFEIFNAINKTSLIQDYSQSSEHGT